MDDFARGSPRPRRLAGSHRHNNQIEGETAPTRAARGREYRGCRHIFQFGRCEWPALVDEEGKILRSIDRYGNIGKKLEPSAISYILRQVQANITLPGNKKPRQWTGHSFRVGAAVDLVESGYTIEQVMRKGDWKSVQAGLRYVMAE